MHVESIPLGQLKPWPKNPRTGETDAADLVASIKAEGLLQPLVVAKNAEGYYVIAGNRRLKALQQLAGSAGDIVPCHVLPNAVALDEDKLTEIALAENAVRVDMHPMDECEAFARLAGEGKDLPAIAAAFNVSERFVRQRLQLAALDEKARTMFREGKIDYRGAIALARLADPKAVAKALKLVKKGWDPVGAANQTRGDERRFYVKHARFDVAAASLKTEEDLFEVDREGAPMGPYFADYPKAVKLQGEWLGQHIIGLKESGKHAFVEIQGERDQFWSTYRTAADKETKGVGLVLKVQRDGSVEEVRAVSLKAERKAEAEAAKKKAKKGKPRKLDGADADELPQAFKVDLRQLHRIAVMRHLASDPNQFAAMLDELVSFSPDFFNGHEDVTAASEAAEKQLRDTGKLPAALATHIRSYAVSEKVLNKLKGSLKLGEIEWPRSMLERLPRPYLEAELKALKIETKPTAKKGELVELVWKNRPKGWVPAFAKL